MNSFKDKFKIAKVLASLFTHSATPEEEKTYHAWLEESPDNQELAERILNKETYEKNNKLMKDFPSQQGWEKIYPLLGEETSFHRFSWKRTLKYAAFILLLVIPSSYLIYNWTQVAEEPFDVIAPGVRGGEVILSDGNTLRIPDDFLPEGAIEVFIIDSLRISYHTPANKPQAEEQKNVFQTLHGMEFSIILSDGTSIHLNAETKLTYPVCFNGKQRIVQIEGEAYFDVAPDKEHPFIVQMPHGFIRVTGTSFNVRTYPDERTECITLTSGSVTVINGDEQVDLTPGQQYVYDKASGKDSVANVDTELYTSWQSGMFTFKSATLEEVMSYISKWYGCKYVFNDEKARTMKTSGSLNRYENMNSIIDAIKKLDNIDIKQRDGVLHISHVQ